MKREASGEDSRVELQLSDDAAFHKREQAFKRVGVAALYAVLVAALAGLFGSGPLSHASARSADGSVRVDYDRIVRANAPTELRFHVPYARKVDGSVELWLDQSFAQSIMIEQIVPAPVRTRIVDGRLKAEIVAAAADTALGITLTYRPKSLGSTVIDVGVDAGQVHLRQFVFP